MSRIYFVLLPDGRQKALGVLDLENPPLGVFDTKVEHPWPHGVAIGLWIKDHLPLAATFLDELAAGQLSDEAKGFFSNVASFWENLPPSGEAKVGVFSCIGPGHEAEFFRTSPEVAASLFAKVSIA